MHYALRHVLRRPPPSLSYCTNVGSGSDLTTYTFSSASIGTPNKNRTIIVAAMGGNATAARTVSSLTVGGFSAVKLVEGSSGFYTVSIWAVVVPAGSTADIVVTWSAGQSRSSAGVWACYDLKEPLAALDTATATADPSTLIVRTDNQGIVIAAANSSTGGGGTNWTWTGAVTENFDDDTSWETLQSGASAANVPAGQASVTSDPSAGTPAVAVVSLR